MNFNRHKIETLFQKCSCSSSERNTEQEKKRKKMDDDDEAAKRVTFDKILQKGAGLKQFLAK